MRFKFGFRVLEFKI